MDSLEILPVLEDPDRPKYRDVHPDLLKPPFRMSIVGASKSGKSNYLMNLLRPSFYGGSEKKKIEPCFNKIIAFSPNLGLDSTTRALTDIAGEDNMHMTYDDSKIQRIMDSQREKGDIRDKILIIADDLIALGANPQALIFSSATYLRHLDCSIIYITQTYKGHYSLPPLVRNNLEALVMFKCPSAQQINSMCEDLMGTFGSKENVKNMLDYATQKPYSMCFYNYRDLKVYKNHTEFIWEKYDKNGNYSADFVRKTNPEEEDYSSEDEN